MSAVGKFLAALMLLFAVISIAFANKNKVMWQCLFNGASCSDCTENSQCYWCSSIHACLHYPGWAKISPGDCREWYHDQCVIAGNVIIILVSSLVGVFLLVLGCCVCCCYCRYRCKYWGSWRERDDRDEMGIWRRSRIEMQERHAQREGEREIMRDEIRKKYGLQPRSEARV